MKRRLIVDGDGGGQDNLLISLEWLHLPIPFPGLWDMTAVIRMAQYIWF